ncbi:MAG: acetyl-CoA carboxylase biotin carboxyl carrier protein [Gammaproteobacteria bacterium]|jgi:acetyl-CoA carboxylase biotin carboxyl carrier protein|nr:acetyl-CoA carboxylase biotin carboxyl carrier protein [Gammaproteobacteria bacterium]NBP07385.1 acetyl-CoA carboxylase biotin carboxyl carrier protein [Gammaproteobacteria bacterium]NBR17168.1 acetyl-CoA carboxylase biotin carboxyl carrier protein [Gammaproteobacteria bacterium]NCW20268.1 acetyl-CoA carboxylase biotin carboxyl carrier protein [Gammaproteobacteria bacterium]NCW57523.1 acetyl-CoA carboxylase biotin carboxyl carrier protein [Gammaproteobacteria bacterium]
MDIRKVKKLIELLEESGIAELEIKEGEESVRISRMASGATATQTVYAAPPMPPAVAAAVASTPTGGPASAAPPPSVDHLVQAPMVGTYYSAPAPGAKAFVQIGDEVKVGQVLCIIEAMKMMNQIESDRAGKITSVLVQNGDPVEFGQPLFAIQ